MTAATDHTSALVDLLRQLAVTHITASLDATGQWWATGTHQGRTHMTVDHPTRTSALEELARTAISGAYCHHCGRPTVLGPTVFPGRCRWTLRNDTYTPSCDRSTP